MNLVKESLNDQNNQNNKEFFYGRNESDPKIKSFEDIQIGDKAFSYSEREYEGEILAKGSFNELYDKYEST